MATKNNLADLISKKIKDLSQGDALEALDLVFEYIKEELTKGNRVEIRGFGSFSVRKRKFANKEGSYKIIYYRNSATKVGQAKII